MPPKSASKNGRVAPQNKQTEDAKQDTKKNSEPEAVNTSNGVPSVSFEPPPRSKFANFIHRYIFPGPLYNFSCR